VDHKYVCIARVRVGVRVRRTRERRAAEKAGREQTESRLRADKEQAESRQRAGREQTERGGCEEDQGKEGSRESRLRADREQTESRQRADREGWM
jgi:hypothetical protein